MLNRFQLKDIGHALQTMLRMHCTDAFCCMDDCLAGGCAIAAYASHRLLNALKVPNTLVMGEDDGSGCHCWVQLAVNGVPHVLDATLGQFYCKDLYPFENEDFEPAERITGPAVEPLTAYKARHFYPWFTRRRKTNGAAIKELMSGSWGGQAPVLYTETIDEFVEAQLHRYQNVQPKRKTG